MNIEKYLQMESVPAGAILMNIIRRNLRSQSDVARAAGLTPQKLHDLASGVRRFNPQISLALEIALGINQHGFFYKLQANHDIHKEIVRTREKPDLQKLTRTTFWDIEMETFDWAACPYWTIQRVLEYGTPDELKELSRFYGKDKVLEVYEKRDTFRFSDKASSIIKQTELV